MSDQALCDRFTGIMADFTAYMAKHLPDDVVAKLKELRSQQNTELANIIYDTMFANQEAAARRNVPSCQDTGVIQYFIQCGSKFPLLGDLPKCLPEAAKLATQRAPLRHNAVQIFDEKNSGNNTGVRIPYLDWEIIPDSDECTIYAYLAGGGCSLPGHGPNGVGGVKSVMGVNVEQAARHPSCLAAAVNVGCWAHRRAGIHFKADLSYEIFTHKGVTL